MNLHIVVFNYRTLAYNLNGSCENGFPQEMPNIFWIDYDQCRLILNNIPSVVCGAFSRGFNNSLMRDQ